MIARLAWAKVGSKRFQLFESVYVAKRYGVKVLLFTHNYVLKIVIEHSQLAYHL